MRRRNREPPIKATTMLWKGDVKNMLLDHTRVVSLGWMPKHSGEKAVRLTSKKMIGRERSS